MAERYEVVIDFAKYQIGDKRGPAEQPEPPNNIDYDSTPSRSCAFDVVAEPPTSRRQHDPGQLNPPRRSWTCSEPPGQHRGMEFKRRDQRAVDDQRPDLGRRHRQQFRVVDRRSPAGRRGDVGARPTTAAAGSTRCTSTSSTSRSSTATVSRPSPTSWVPRTSSTSARTSRSG